MNEEPINVNGRVRRLYRRTTAGQFGENPDKLLFQVGDNRDYFAIDLSDEYADVFVRILFLATRRDLAVNVSAFPGQVNVVFDLYVDIRRDETGA